MNDSEREKTVGEIHRISSLTDKAKALGEEAVALYQEYCDRHGPLTAPGKVPFLESLWKNAGDYGVLAVFQEVLEEEVGQSIPEFEKVLYERLLGLAKGEIPPTNPPVSIEPFSYVWMEQNRLHNLSRAGNEVDFGRLNRLLAFLRSTLADTPGSETRAARVGKTTEILSAIEDYGGVLPPSTGQTDFELKEKLAEGAHGVVWKAHHVTLGCDVAVKFIKDLPADNEEEKKRALDRFLQEARTQFSLRHPNIVSVYNASRSGDEIHIVQELVEGGRTIEHLLAEKGALDAPQLFPIARSLASALGFAEDRGVIHRDIKPSNVLMTPDGTPKLTDFGIAKHLHGPAKLTVTGTMIGTPLYMSPEQIQGKRLTHKSDQFSFGALLYHMATGAPPFTEDSEGEEGCDDPERDPGEPDTFWRLRDAIVHRDPDPIPEIIPSFEVSLSSVIRRCLEKDPDRRFDTFADLERALGGANDGSPPVVRSRWKRAPVLAGVLLALGALFLALLAPWEKPEEAPSPTMETKAESSSTSEREFEEKLPRSPVPSHRSERVPTPSSQTIGPPAVPLAVNPVETPKTEKPVSPEPLRKRLAAFRPTPQNVSFVVRLMDLFGTHRNDLRRGSYDALEQALRSAPGGEGDYGALHRNASIELVTNARRGFQIRLAELPAVRSPVTLALADGGVVSGRVEKAGSDAIVIRNESGSVETLPTKLIAPSALVPQNAPLEVFLAYKALSWKSADTLGPVLSALETQDELVPWVPILVRLARLEIRSHAEAAALEAKELLAEKRQVEETTSALRGYVAAAAGAKAALAKEAEILQLYGYLGPEFVEIRRDIESLDSLLARRYSRVLSGFQSTAAYPIAAELLFGESQRELNLAHDELLARTGWDDYKWRLDPPERTPEETARFWDLDNVTGGSVLQAELALKRLLMQEGHELAPAGVSFRARFQPSLEIPALAHWRFYLRADGGGESYVRSDGARLEVYRSRLAVGEADELLARADLAPAADKAGFRDYLFARGDDHLHFFVDGKIVMSVHATSAQLPRALEFAVEQGKLRIATVKVRKSK